MNDKQSRAIQRRLGGSDATLSELLKKAFVVLVVSETASFAMLHPELCAFRIIFFSSR
jgi:hypothetical protein